MTRLAQSPPHFLQPPPFPLRMAAILCAGIGFHELLDAASVSLPLLASHSAPWPPLVANPLGALLIAAAGVSLWLRKRLGVALLVLGVVLPLAVAATYEGPVRGPGILLILAAVLVLLNVRSLH